MRYTYKNAEIKIDNQDLVLDNITISVNANIQGVFVEGRNGSYDFAAEDGINGNIELSYFLTGRDPIKTFTKQDGVISGYFGGLSIPSGYLSSYSLNFSPNQIPKANANIVFFNTPSGSFTPTYNSAETDFKFLNVSDFSITGHSIGKLDDIESISYNFTQAVIPQYIINESIPRKILTQNKRASMNVLGADLTGILPYHGSNAYIEITLSHPRIINFSDNIFIDGRVSSRQINTSNNSVINNSFTINQNYIVKRPIITSTSKTKTRGGDIISFNGVNMLNAKKVLFCVNGESVPRKEAVFSIVSDSLIRAIVPFGASNGMVEILSE